MAEAGYPVETEEIRVFVGMGTIQEHPEHTTAYEADIRRARPLLNLRATGRDDRSSRVKAAGVSW